MDSNKQPNISIDDAVRWQIRLSEAEADETLRAEFEHWLKQSPTHQAAWEQVTLLDNEMAPLADAMLASLASDSEPHSTPWWRTLFTPQTLTWGAAVAGTFLVALLVVWPQQSTVQQKSYATAAGEHLNVNLPDGSIIQLGALSRLETSFSDSQRHTVLVQGEAYFQVAHHPHKPFVVDVGDIKVRVLGTSFNINKRATRTSVTTVEGLVSVKPKTASVAKKVNPGYQANLRSDGEFSIAAVNTDEPTAWRNRMLVFNDTPMAEFIGDLNRYVSKPLSLRGEELNKHRITGAVSVRDSDAILSSLEAGFNMKVISGEQDQLVLVPDAPEPQ